MYNLKLASVLKGQGKTKERAKPFQVSRWPCFVIAKGTYWGSLPKAAARWMDPYTSQPNLKSLYRGPNWAQSRIPHRCSQRCITISRLCPGAASGNWKSQQNAHSKDKGGDKGPGSSLWVNSSPIFFMMFPSWNIFSLKMEMYVIFLKNNKTWKYVSRYRLTLCTLKIKNHQNPMKFN